jgi:VIT1/CCC1 family predicted Fe2+/Mn2+ transporter
MVTAERDTTAIVALVKGITPAGSVLITISPLFLSLAGVIDYVTSFYASIAVGCMLLLLLGVFLGRLSKGNTIRFVVKTLAAGVLTMILMTVVSLFTGGS